jgi:Domain of unknown function (DUF4169)
VAELINLRTARKRHRRQQDERHAAVNRLAHGQTKHDREREAAERSKSARDHDGHRIDGGDDR